MATYIEDKHNGKVAKPPNHTFEDVAEEMLNGIFCHYEPPDPKRMEEFGEKKKRRGILRAPKMFRRNKKKQKQKSVRWSDTRDGEDADDDDVLPVDIQCSLSGACVEAGIEAGCISPTDQDYDGNSNLKRDSDDGILDDEDYVHHTKSRSIAKKNMHGADEESEEEEDDEEEEDEEETEDEDEGLVSDEEPLPKKKKVSKKVSSKPHQPPTPPHTKKSSSKQDSDKEMARPTRSAKKPNKSYHRPHQDYDDISDEEDEEGKKRVVRPSPTKKKFRKEYVDDQDAESVASSNASSMFRRLWPGRRGRSLSPGRKSNTADSDKSRKKKKTLSSDESDWDESVPIVRGDGPKKQLQGTRRPDSLERKRDPSPSRPSRSRSAERRPTDGKPARSRSPAARKQQYHPAHPLSRPAGSAVYSSDLVERQSYITAHRKSYGDEARALDDMVERQSYITAHRDGFDGSKAAAKSPRAKPVPRREDQMDRQSHIGEHRRSFEPLPVQQRPIRRSLPPPEQKEYRTLRVRGFAKSPPIRVRSRSPAGRLIRSQPRGRSQSPSADALRVQRIQPRHVQTIARPPTPGRRPGIPSPLQQRPLPQRSTQLVGQQQQVPAMMTNIGPSLILPQHQPPLLHQSPVPSAATGAPTVPQQPGTPQPNALSFPQISCPQSDCLPSQQHQTWLSEQQQGCYPNQPEGCWPLTLPLGHPMLQQQQEQSFGQQVAFQRSSHSDPTYSLAQQVPLQRTGQSVPLSYSYGGIPQQSPKQKNDKRRWLPFKKRKEEKQNINQAVPMSRYPVQNRPPVMTFPSGQLPPGQQPPLLRPAPNTSHDDGTIQTQTSASSARTIPEALPKGKEDADGKTGKKDDDSNRTVDPVIVRPATPTKQESSLASWLPSIKYPSIDPVSVHQQTDPQGAGGKQTDPQGAGSDKPKKEKEEEAELSWEERTRQAWEQLRSGFTFETQKEEKKDPEKKEAEEREPPSTVYDTLPYGDKVEQAKYRPDPVLLPEQGRQGILKQPSYDRRVTFGSPRQQVFHQNPAEMYAEPQKQKRTPRRKKLFGKIFHRGGRKGNDDLPHLGTKSTEASSWDAGSYIGQPQVAQQQMNIEQRQQPPSTYQQIYNLNNCPPPQQYGPSCPQPLAPSVGCLSVA